MREISIKELYIALEEDPDLRRLGAYKVKVNEGSAIIPIDVTLLNKDIHLGDGDFTEGLGAIGPKCRSFNLGNSKFTDLYLDYMVVDEFHLDGAYAGRVFYDYAKIGVNYFERFKSPEVYYDLAEIGEILLQDLQVGIMYLAKLKVKKVDPGNLDPKKIRFALDKGGATEFGNVPLNISEQSEKLADPQEVATVFSVEEFLQVLQENPDLRRLKKYVVKGEGNLVLNEESLTQGVYFGEGDFTGLHISFGNAVTSVVNLGNSLFSKIDLGAIESDTVDLGKSQFDALDCGAARIKGLFLGDSHGLSLHFNELACEVIFGERAKIDGLFAEYSNIGQINLNHLKCHELRLGQSVVEALYLSNGSGVENVLCEEVQMTLLNFHEARLKQIDFGACTLRRALLNKCSAEKIDARGLKADILYLDDFTKNTVGFLDIGEMKTIKHLDIGNVLPKKQEEGAPPRRHIFGTIRFGSTKEVEENKQVLELKGPKMF